MSFRKSHSPAVFPHKMQVGRVRPLGTPQLERTNISILSLSLCWLLRQGSVAWAASNPSPGFDGTVGVTMPTHLFHFKY